MRRVKDQRLSIADANRLLTVDMEPAFWQAIVGLINYPGSELAPYRTYLPRLAGLGIDALLPGHLLFTLRNGQAHIDLALARMAKSFVPLSIGQLDVIFRPPDDY